MLLVFASGAYSLPTGLNQDLLRVVGLLALIPYGFFDRGDAPIPRVEARLQKQQVGTFKSFALGYALYVLPSTLLHAQFGMLLIHTAGAALLLTVVRALSSDGGATAARIAPQAFGFAMAVSLVMAFLVPDQAIIQGRLRGMFVNANLLGFYAFLSLMSAILLARRVISFLLLTTMSFWVILWTDSRTSAIAAVLAIVLLALFSHRRARQLLLIIIGAACLVYFDVLHIGAVSSSRDLGTRDGSWDEALRVLNVAPFTGVGNGATAVEVASTPLRALAEGGVLALAGVGVMYLVLLRASSRQGRYLLAVCVGSIVHSLGEGWFLSSLSPMLLAFVMVWIGVSALGCSDAPGQRRAETARRSVRKVILGPLPNPSSGSSPSTAWEDT